MAFGLVARLAQVVGKALPLLQRATPYISRGAQALQNPFTRASIGGGLGVMTNNEGTLGGKIRGGLMGAGLGYASGPWGQGLLTKGLTRVGLPLAQAGPVANLAIPAAGILYGGQQSQGSVGNQVAQGVDNVAQGGGNVVQGGFNTGAINMAQTPNMPLPGNPNTTNVSGQHGQMMTMPDGSVWQQIDPRGYQQGIRYGSGLDTMQNISNQNKWFESVLPQWDEIERRKQARAIQNSQIASNIALARQLAGNRQIADLNIAQTQAGSMGNMFANTVTPSLSLG